MIIISKIVVCITSVLENATPIANDLRENNFMRIIVNSIWQILAVSKKNHAFDEIVFSRTISWGSRNNPASRPTKGKAKTILFLLERDQE